MELCLASHRAVLKALQAFEDGELSLRIDGAVTVETTRGRLRFAGGVCFEAPRPGWVGAELVGWLEETERLSGVGAWWRPGLRAVLRSRDGHVALTAPSQDLLVEGVPATSGTATHAARFLVAHGEMAEPGVTSSGVVAPAGVTSRGEVAPATVTSNGVEPSSRARGTSHATGAVPWTLRQVPPVAPPPRPSRERYGPLPPVAPPPPRSDAYASPEAGVHTLPPVTSPPRPDASSIRRLPRVA